MGMSSYFQVKQFEDGSFAKPGVRGFPYLDAAQALLLETLGQLELSGSVLDSMSRAATPGLDRGTENHAPQVLYKTHPRIA